MIHKGFDFSCQKTKLYGQFWQASQTKAIVILVHGMGEHSSRYADFVVPELLKNDISVMTYDQFGHGKTQGKRGHNPGFDAVLDCVQIVIDKATTIFGDKPLFLYGHSMGGNVVINYILMRKYKLKGVIATSPFLKLAFQPPKWKLILGKLIQNLVPSVTMGNELDVNAISRDKTQVQKYISDPLIHDRISPNYSLSFIKSGQWAIDNAEKITLPVLILHGTGDRLTSYKGSEEFASHNKKNITLKLYQDGYHELHNDLCKKDFILNIVHWIELQLKKKRKS